MYVVVPGPRQALLGHHPFFLSCSYNAHCKSSCCCGNIAGPRLVSLLHFNFFKAHCHQGTRHAEFIAIEEMLRSHPRSLLRSTDLYVTVEPCVMCASALRQYRIRAVYFGCANDRFGGTGSILSLHSEYVCLEIPTRSKLLSTLASR